MLSYVWKTECLPAATDCSATTLHSGENFLHKLCGSVLWDGNMYVWKQLGQIENDINTSVEGFFFIDKVCKNICSVSIATKESILI